MAHEEREWRDSALESFPVCPRLSKVQKRTYESVESVSAKTVKIQGNSVTLGPRDSSVVKSIFCLEDTHCDPQLSAIPAGGLTPSCGHQGHRHASCAGTYVRTEHP